MIKFRVIRVRGKSHQYLATSDTIFMESSVDMSLCMFIMRIGLFETCTAIIPGVEQIFQDVIAVAGPFDGHSNGPSRAIRFFSS